MRRTLPKESTHGKGNSFHEVPMATTTFVFAQYLWKCAVTSSDMGNPACGRSCPLTSIYRIDVDEVQ